MDPAQRNVLVACLFTALLFSALLRLASRAEDASTAWLELAFGLANLVALNWVVVRLYRQIRRMEAEARREPGVA